jgi:hypothetical protein
MSEERPVDCPYVAERLPWLLTGALNPEENRTVRDHLVSCPTCQGDLQSARLAAEVFDAHLPAGVVVDLAWNRPPAGIDPDTVRRHLERCPSCAEELALARESRRLESEGETRHRTLSFPSGAWRWGALAASLPLAFIGGSAWRATRDAAGLVSLESEKRHLEARIGDLQGRVERSQVDGRALQQQVDRLAAPQPNVTVVEALPGATTMRSAQGSGETRVTIAAGATWVVLLLNLEKTPAGPAAVEVRDQTERVIWRGGGLRPSSLGGYALGIPSSLLPQGRYEVALLTPEGRALGVYSLRVLRTE